MKYQYKIFDIERNGKQGMGLTAEECLNFLGSQGWELVSWKGLGIDTGEYIFKREVTENTDVEKVYSIASLTGFLKESV